MRIVRRLSRRTALQIAALALVGIVQAGTAAAQISRPVRIIIPGPPGGSSDIMARILSDDLSKALGQTVIIEARPGAGGNVATDFVAKSPPDGHTLLFGDIGPLAINPTLFASLSYDPIKDFEPIARIALFPWVMIVHPSLPAKTLPEVFELARRTPGGLSFATPGLGTPMHLTGEILKRAANVELVHVPYKGGGPATLDVVAGQVKLGIVGLPPAVPHIRSGGLRAIAVSTVQRAPSIPDVPSMQEGGVKDFDASVWYGVLAPRGTPKTVIDAVNVALRDALRKPEIAERFAKSGVVPAYLPPDEFRRFIEAENARWAPVVRSSGARAE